MSRGFRSPAARRSSPRRMVAIGASAALIIVLISLCVGRYSLTWPQLVGVVLGRGSPGALGMFWQVRLPRVLLAFLSGGSLAIAGAALQGIMRNPLVSPDIIGVSAGASLGAAAAIVVGGGAPGTIQTLAFCGGLLVAAGAFLLSRATGGSIISLVLSGIIINALAQAGVSLLKYLADPLQQLPALEFWLLGGFYTADWSRLLSVLPAFLIGGSSIIVFRWQLNVLSQGEDEARALGVDVTRLRFLLMAASALLVAAVVSVAGTVGWIGLVGPHIARLMAGSDHSHAVPLSFWAGAGLLLLADTLARTVTMAEIPVSVLTALIGAPFLACLLWRMGGQAWNR